MITICGISDTHTYHRKVEIPKCDILCVSGDLTYKGERHVLVDFDKWCGNLKEQQLVKEVVIIAGNHDLVFDSAKYNSYNPYAKDIFTNCIYLENSSCEVLGLKIYGSPATPAFCNWAFNYTHQELVGIFSKIPEDTDILLTHGPCYKILDNVARWETKVTAKGERTVKKIDHVGCKALLEVVGRVKPKLHIFGHLHDGHGKYLGEDTIFINGSICTEQYQPTNQPIVVGIIKNS